MTTLITSLPIPFFPGDVTPEAVAAACEVPTSSEAGLVCRNVYTWTENDLVARGADWLATRPLKIIFIFLVAIVVNRIARRLIRRFVSDLSSDGALARKERLRNMTPRSLQSTTMNSPLRTAARAETVGSVLKSITAIVIYSIAALMALGEVGINLAPLIAGAGVIGVALGFGAQSLVKDFLSGLFMLAEDQYGVGDVIDVGEATGTVEVVNLRTTRLRGVDGTVWHVPNGEIRRVGNMSQQWARALMDIDVSYGTDVDVAMATIKEVADGLWREDTWQVDVLEEPEIWGVQHLGADGVTLRLVLKTQPGRQWAVSRELNRRIKARFDEDGIEIPFPQRVMWMRQDPGSSIDTRMAGPETTDTAAAETP